MCELTLAVSQPPTGEEQVVQEEPHGEEFAWRGVRSDLGGVSQLTLAPTILSSFYIYLLFCNKTSAM
jgi:hypothetical protein